MGGVAAIEEGTPHSRTMEFCIFTEPQQGATYDDLLAVAQTAERLGFDGFFRSDHYMVMGDGDGLPGPTDAWTTLAGLARETSTIRLGTLVSSATHRHPAVLAIQVAGVDQMSGGRVDFGLGTGWFEAEHTALGIPFPAKRFDRFEEQLDIITGLWASEGPFSYAGEHYTLVDAPPLPKPVQSKIPVIIGGGGPRRTPAIAGKYADEYNIGWVTPAVASEKFAAVREAANGRQLKYSVALTAAVGRTDAAWHTRAEAIGRAPESMTEFDLGGTVAQVTDRIAALRDVGTDRLYIQIMDLHDLDHLELIAAEVLPTFR